MGTLDEMRKDPKWVLSLAKAADARSKEGWCRGQRGPPQRLRLSLKALAKTDALGAENVAKIEACFSAEKVDNIQASYKSLDCLDGRQGKSRQQKRTGPHIPAAQCLGTYKNQKAHLRRPATGVIKSDDCYVQLETTPSHTIFVNPKRMIC